jgi:hypothetical protein
MIEQTPTNPPPLPDWCIPVCRLWIRKNEKGAHLSGRLGGAKIIIFPNPDRRDENDAEWILTFSS